MDFLEEEFDEILNIFQAESEEIIARLNSNLMELEKKPSNKDLILCLFRDAHSLKGASRLIGFNNIQTIAHKVEDILGLAKEGTIQFNSPIVDILLKTVDFMSDLISKSILKKQEVYTEEIATRLSNLENIKEHVDFEDAKKNELDFDIKLLSQEIEQITELISDCLVNLMRIEHQGESEPIDELLFNVNSLYEIFSSIGHFELKKHMEDLKVKLDFVSKVASGLTVQEIEQMQQVFDEIITELVSLSEIYDFEVSDYYTLAFDKMAELQNACVPIEAMKTDSPNIAYEKRHFEKSEETKLTEFDTDKDIANDANEKMYSRTDFDTNIEFGDLKENSSAHLLNNSDFSNLSHIRQKLVELPQNCAYLAEIRNVLDDFAKGCQNKEVEQIFQSIIKILNFADEYEIIPDADAIAVLIQSFDSCEELFNGNKENIDVELILQRLTIVRQLMEISGADSNDKDNIVKKGFAIKNKKLVDFSTIFDSGDIKTLRVDSSKLDVLANQIGELMISKIKTKKHLQELNNITMDLKDLQGNSQKVIGYLKYYDKKFFSHGDASENPVSYFIKQFLHLFNENNKRFSQMSSNISGLARTIQEDDTKTNLIVDDLEHMVKNIRVLPFATVFHIFGRMVRDIALEKNKKIELEIYGSETTTDKKILEEIKSPLIHIIRNSIDHGIETPDERIALGKNPVGKIMLRAKSLDNKVILEIEDDGKGINIEKIKAKALKNGYLTEDEMISMSNEQITNLIFTPGFSTGEEITNISGRGIGLDVVQTKINQLNGKVKVISEVNKGCCVQIELPTSMSTVKVFLVTSANQIFAVPMDFIDIVVWKTQEEIFCNNENRTIVHNGKNIPLYRLTDLLQLKKMPPPQSSRETVLVLDADNRTIGLSVDKLVGDQEILLKPLCAPLYKLKNISGVTTLASGAICLILNMTNIIKHSVSTPILPPTKTQQYSLPVDNSNYKILLVDDSITTRTLEKNILTRVNYKIETATNPIEAYEKLKHTRFDLIITDIEMPEMNGFEFLNKLKSDEMYFDIPVIMVSSLASAENEKNAIEHGAFAYIVKSDFGQSEFLNLVQSAIAGNN